jgi:hypothetical protein
MPERVCIFVLLKRANDLILEKTETLNVEKPKNPILRKTEPIREKPTNPILRKTKPIREKPKNPNLRKTKS